jgi:hypothetical protein
MMTRTRQLDKPVSNNVLRIDKSESCDWSTTAETSRAWIHLCGVHSESNCNTLKRSHECSEAEEDSDGKNVFKGSKQRT